VCGVCRCVRCVSVCFLSGGLCTEHKATFFGYCDYLYINISKNVLQYVTTILLIQKVRGSDVCYLKGGYRFAYSFPANASIEPKNNPTL